MHLGYPGQNYQSLPLIQGRAALRRSLRAHGAATKESNLFKTKSAGIKRTELSSALTNVVSDNVNDRNVPCARAGAGPVVYGLAALLPQITTRYN